MPWKFRCVSTIALLTISSIIFAEDTPVPVTPVPTGRFTGEAQDSLSNLSTYLLNLGEYFGYDLTAYCQSGGPCTPTPNGAVAPYSNDLLDPNATYAVQLNSFNTYLGAIIGGGSQNTTAYNPIIPTSSTNNYSLIDTLAGQTYSNSSYSTPNSKTSISVSSLIDQQSYQPDPVSQAVLNIIATPNYTFCQKNNSQNFIPNCPILFRELIMSNVIGTLQGTETAFSADSNQSLVPQLNADTLLSPLLYSTTPLTTTSSSSSDTTTNGNPGLTAMTQAQQAANFIRYVISEVNPLSLLDSKHLRQSSKYCRKLQ